MTDDPIKLAAEWRTFFERPGGLRDMLHAFRAERYKMMDDADPRQVAILANLALGSQAAKYLEEAVLLIIGTGEVNKQAKAAADKVASMPEYRRRWVERV